MTDDLHKEDQQQNPPQRKRFVFKKRDPVEAARLEAERQSNIKHSPFGDAKPREAVIAQRTGKDETKILEEEASEYQVKLRLTPEQFAEKKQRLDEIEELKAVIAEGQADDLDDVKVQLQNKEAELASLLKGFESLLIEKAKAGELARPVDRRREQRSDSENSGRPGYSRSDYYDNYGDAGGERPRNNRGNFTGGNYSDEYGRGGDGGSRAFPGFDKQRGGGGYGRGYEEAGGYHQDRRGGGSYSDRDFTGGGYQERGGGGGGGGYRDKAVFGGRGGDYGRDADTHAQVSRSNYPLSADDVDYHSPYERR